MWSVKHQKVWGMLLLWRNIKTSLVVMRGDVRVAPPTHINIHHSRIPHLFCSSPCCVYLCQSGCQKFECCVLWFCSNYWRCECCNAGYSHHVFVTPSKHTADGNCLMVSVCLSASMEGITPATSGVFPGQGDSVDVFGLATLWSCTERIDWKGTTSSTTSGEKQSTTPCCPAHRGEPWRAVSNMREATLIRHHTSPAKDVLIGSFTAGEFYFTSLLQGIEVV